MCGRYAIYEPDEIEKRFNVKKNENITANYNAAPTQTLPVIKLDESRHIELMHWGILRMLGEDTVKELINTRSDKAFGRFWRKTVTNYRCLIPANAFYEWKKTSEGKVPYMITPDDQEMFSFAGIWSSWTDKDGKSFDAYSIMTTDANEQMEGVHDRMPVIFRPEDEENWLMIPSEDEEGLAALLRPYAGNLSMVAVSKEINNVKNNNSKLLNSA